MNLTEATDRDIKYIMDLDHDFHYEGVLYHLKKMGFKLLGSGASSEVYHIPFPKYKRVIKINRSPDIYYNDFMKYIKKYGNRNPYLPKVYHLRGRRDESFTVAVLERLEFTDYRKSAYDDELNIIHMVKQYGMTKIGLTHKDMIKKYEVDTNHLLYKTFMMIHKKCDLKLDEFDISSTNIMMRPRTKHLVITDV